MPNQAPAAIHWTSALLVDEALGLAGVAAVDAAAGAGGPQPGEVLAEVRATVAALDAAGALDARLDAAFAAAHKAVMGHPGARLAPMSLTLVLMRGARAGVGHLGGCRLYLVRFGGQEQVTMDHTAANVLTAGGGARSPAPLSPNAIVYGLGASTPDPRDLLPLELVVGDTLILCSPDDRAEAVTLTLGGAGHLESARWPDRRGALDAAQRISAGYGAGALRGPFG
jgi:protein phosphatase